MPNRTFEESILWDAAVKDLSPEAFMLFFRMILVADDYGIVPADQEILTKLIWWPNKLLKKFSGISAELPEKNFLGLLEHNGQQFYVIKPESWDRIQSYHIRKRTQSKYLKLKDAEADQLRRSAIWPFSKTFSGSSQECLRKFLHNARAISTTSGNKTKSISLEQRGGEGEANSNPPTPEPMQHTFPTQPSISADTRASDHRSSVTLVVDMIKAMGARVGIPAYADIAHISWEPKLRAKAVHIGYQCLYHEAEKFCTWFEGEVEAGRIKATAHHNPPARFLNTWLSRVDAKNHTHNDDSWHPNDKSTPNGSCYDL